MSCALLGQLLRKHRYLPTKIMLTCLCTQIKEEVKPVAFEKCRNQWVKGVLWLESKHSKEYTEATQQNASRLGLHFVSEFSLVQALSHAISVVVGTQVVF